MHLPPGLFPSRIGLETMYTDQMLLRDDLTDDPKRQERIMDFGPAYFAVDGQDEEFPLLSTAITLMSSRPPSRPIIQPISQEFYKKTYQKDNRSITNAISSNGVCLCSCSLTRQFCDVTSMGLVDVVLGRIEFEGKSYSTLLDSADRHDDLEGSGRPDFLDFKHFSLVVKEKVSSLQVAFEFRHSEDASFHTRLVGPAKLVEQSIHSRGKVYCDRISCKRASQAVVIEEQPGYQLYQFGGQKIETFQAQ